MSEATLRDYLGPAPDHWDVVPFKKAFDDMTSGNPSIKQSDYLDEGVLAVVDQGQDAIGGYTDDPEMACSADLPCIVFGDHTRAFKYVDHPFAIGAQGTRVLVPKGRLQPRFAYHYLRQLRLPDSGYSRHYKFLKREAVPVPPPGEQEQITDALDRAEAAKAKQRRALARLDALLAAVFDEMFGDPVTNPMGLDTSKIGNVTDVATGATPSRKKKEIYFDGDIPWVKTGEVGSVITSTEELITSRALAETNCKLFPKGTVLVAMYGQGKTRGKAGLLGIEAATNQACAAILPSTELKPVFLYFQLGLMYERLRALGRGGNQANLNLGMVKSFEVLCPAYNDQERFAEIVRQSQPLRQRLIDQGARLDALYAALAARAFRGDLALAPEPA